ncbi:MAG TPA: cation-translocating P-type ATPase [Steroidobacteraceae bacterium]|nr:cation-translocating P-type ATPase [Steroidobacteraceae bacterium]
MSPPDSRAASLVGLTSAEAAERLRRVGYNELPAADHHSLLALVLEVIREPMFALLVGSAFLYAFIGDLGEAVVLGLFACGSVSIAVIQRERSERVLEALRDLTSPRALVIRDGERRRIPGREVVPGDLCIVTEGDRIPADAVLLEGADIHVDESLLTGESLPVRKKPTRESESIVAAPPGGEDLPNLFSGTLVQRGTGLARVIATGSRSEIGKIGGAVRSIAAEPPRLQTQTKRLVVIFAIVGLTCSAVAVLVYGYLHGQWIQAALGGIALGMSLLPEEFPLVLTVFMVMGAWRLSRSRVLTRRATAIETLGAATVLCTDKTGTLTRNVMSVGSLRSSDATWSRDRGHEVIRQHASLAELLRTATLACEPQALDAMERAIVQLAAESGVSSTQAGRLAKTYPLRPGLLAFTQVWQADQSDECIVASKGAPEAIVTLCALDADRRRQIATWVDELAREGMRVLAVAKGRCSSERPPDSVTDVPLEFLGLVALADPLRDSVPGAVRECRAAGIRVIMITGDYPETARAIARQAGIADGALITGDEVERMDDVTLADAARSATVFARIKPNQKLRIVAALKANGEIVAMTGDGVNDAPALKAAHIGIAMGGRGTDVAREASSIVLLDDDFGSIVRAIRGGRRIYDNLRKAFAYILAIHIPTAGLALLPIVLGQPLLLTPMLIAFLELIIDPACSVVLEAEHEERNIMSRPPRDPRSPLFSRALAGWSVLQGVSAWVVVAAVYLTALRMHMPDEELRALTFVALIGANLALILSSRTFGSSLLASVARPNASLGWGLGLVVIALAVVLGVPVARNFFGLGPLHADDLSICAGVALALLGLLSLLKRLWGAQLAA